jgi:hypothetical protein
MRLPHTLSPLRLKYPAVVHVLGAINVALVSPFGSFFHILITMAAGTEAGDGSTCSSKMTSMRQALTILTNESSQTKNNRSESMVFKKDSNSQDAITSMAETLSTSFLNT